jgi:hypothetical protein
LDAFGASHSLFSELSKLLGRVLKIRIVPQLGQCLLDERLALKFGTGPFGAFGFDGFVGGGFERGERSEGMRSAIPRHGEGIG